MILKTSIISNLFISVLLIVPLLFKTTGVFSDVSSVLVNGLNPLLIFLIIFNLIGLIALKLVSQYANFIDTKDLLEHNEKQEKLENNVYYKGYRIIILTLLFGLLMYNKMFLATIFACIWWLSRHLFKTNFDKFVKEIE